MALQQVIGEKCCFGHKIVILENSDNEVKVALPGKRFACIDEIRKRMPRGKKLNINVLEPDNIESLFVKLYDLFGVYSYRRGKVCGSLCQIRG